VKQDMKKFVDACSTVNVLGISHSKDTPKVMSFKIAIVRMNLFILENTQFINS